MRPGRLLSQRWWIGPALAAATALSVCGPASAQVPPLLAPTTTTTAPPATTTTAAPGSQSVGPFSDASPAPKGAQDVGGDGQAPPVGGIRVPPEAQRIIDSVPRTRASSTDALLAALNQLEALGVPQAEVYRIGLGRFPIAGPARYGHDWLYPRYGPGFRFHLGTDVFAAYGTPVRAPVDGIAKSSHNGLGGLTVKVFMADGTYFYLAHLSGLVDGFVDGMAVHTGDIVGYVGDSGNAKGGAPHVHVGVYPQGGPPVDPKPILDGFLSEALERVPTVVAAAKEAQATAVPASVTTDAGPPAALDEARPHLLRPMLYRVVLRAVAQARAQAEPAWI